MKLLIINKVKEERSSQNLILLIREYVISGLCNIKKIRKFSNPSSGITMKKIIMKACLVIILLNI